MNLDENKHKLPLNLNYIGRIVSEMGPRLRWWITSSQDLFPGSHLNETCSQGTIAGAAVLVPYNVVKSDSL